MRTSAAIVFTALVLCLGKAPLLQAAELSLPAPACAGAVGSDVPWLTDGPEPVELTGCTATATCLYYPPPTSVSCSSPQPGTCSSSNEFCGSVTCNGVTTKCTGGCLTHQYCRTFCKQLAGTTDGFCDINHCCAC